MTWKNKNKTLVNNYKKYQAIENKILVLKNENLEIKQHGLMKVENSKSKIEFYLNQFVSAIQVKFQELLRNFMFLISSHDCS